MSRVKYKLLLGALMLIASSCSKIEIKDATISIKPYNKSDRGKFWEICFDYENRSSSEESVAYFEIHSLDGKEREYEIEFIHLSEQCNNKNILVSFTNRFTGPEEWTWLKDLDADDIDYIYVRVKRSSKEKEYIFEKRINSLDLN